MVNLLVKRWRMARPIGTQFAQRAEHEKGWAESVKVEGGRWTW